MTSAKPAKLYLPEGLRGIAAVGVVLHHEPGLYLTTGYFPRAYLAVDFFFMLSGLVMTLAYEPRLAGGLGLGRFLWRRVERLWPVLAAGILLAGAGAWLASDGQTLGGAVLIPLAMGLLFIPNLHAIGRIYWLNGPQYTVTFEVIANAFHATVLRRLPDWAVLALALAAGAGLWALIGRFGGAGMGDTGQNWWGGFVRVGFAYTIGVWMGRQWRAGRGQVRLGVWGLPVALLLPALLFLSPLLPLSRMAGDRVLVVLAMAPVLWLTAQVRLPAWLEHPADWLGRFSYPLYAVHVPVLVAFARFGRAAPPADQPLWRTGAVIAALALAALITHSPLAQGWPLVRKSARAG